MTTFLIFPDEEIYQLEAAAAGIESSQTTLADGTALDVIGTLCEPVVMSGDGETLISGGEPLSGWHVNLAGNLPDGWAAYVVTPATPRRIFA